MITMEQLTKWSTRFTNRYGALNESDLNKANHLVSKVETSRSKVEPKVGDVVVFTNEYGEYYPKAIIDRVRDNKVTICEHGSPYIAEDNNADGFCLSISGGSFPTVEMDTMKYIGTTETYFWTFGHNGGCADGGIDFYATVSMWECNVNKELFSTKTHDRYKCYYDLRAESFDYKYLVHKGIYSNCAFHNKEDLLAWLRTMRATITYHGEREIEFWCPKVIEHHCSPTEFENVKAEKDIFQFNANYRWCKRTYKEDGIHLYYVWYWEDSETDSMSWEEKNIYMNKKIDEYCIPWEQKPIVNQIARKEFENGIEQHDIHGLFTKREWED